MKITDGYREVYGRPNGNTKKKIQTKLGATQRNKKSLNIHSLYKDIEKWKKKNLFNNNKQNDEKRMRNSGKKNNVE